MNFLQDRYLYIDGTIFFGNTLTYIKLASDMMNFGAFGVLLVGVLVSDSMSGISRKSLSLYIMSTVTRLVSEIPWKILDYDIVHPLMSMCVCSVLILLVTRSRKCCRYGDIFRWKSLILGTLMLSLLFNYSHMEITVKVVARAWGHYLGAVAILPQLAWIAFQPTLGPSRSTVSKVLHVYVNILAFARIPDLVHWAFMRYDQDAYDHIAVIADCFHLCSHFLFLGFVFSSRWSNVRNFRDSLPKTLS